MKLRDKPKNLILIYSNPNKSAIMYDIPEHFDKTFNNVLENENVEEQNCTGQKCKDCLACYKFNDTNVIVEKVKKYQEVKQVIGFIIATTILFFLSVPVMVYLAIQDYKIGMKDYNKEG